MNFLAAIHAPVGTTSVPVNSTFVPLLLALLAVMFVRPPRTEAMPARDEDPDLGDRALPDDHSDQLRHRQAFPTCPRCHEYGQPRLPAPKFERHYICARCDARWTLQWPEQG